MAHLRSVRSARGMLRTPASRIPVRVKLLLNALTNDQCRRGRGGEASTNYQGPRRGARKYIFHRGSNPLSAALSTVFFSCIVICVQTTRRFISRSCVGRPESKHTNAIQFFQIFITKIR